MILNWQIAFCYSLLERDENFKVTAFSPIKDKALMALINIDWVYTEKVDGTNMRIIWKDHDFIIKGRSDKADIRKQHLENITLMCNNRRELFEETFGDKTVCLYGEGYGKGIQKIGRLYSSTLKFVCFDIMFDDKIYANWDAVKEICLTLNIDIVPEYKFNSVYHAISEVSKGIISHYGNFNAEGIVAKPIVSLYKNNGERILFKLKTYDF